MTDLPPELAELLSAWHARDWYALAVVGVVLVMRGITNTPQWALITRRWEWLPPVLLGSVAGLVDAYYSGVHWRLAVLQAVAAGLQIGLGAIGTHHAWKRINETKPTRWRGFPVLLLGIGASGCASSQREACYARAHAAAHAHADAACPDWDACSPEERDAILERYQAAQEACP